MREEALPTLRGRIDIGSQIARRLGQPMPLDCRYQDYDEDTEHNRVIKAAVQRLLQLPAVDRELAAKLRHHNRLFAAVEDVEYSRSRVPELVYSRLNAAWEPAGHLAELILSADSVRDALGATHGISFTVDMNKLFERFVERVTAQVALAHRWTFESQARRRFTDRVVMRPDLVLRRGPRDCAVGDAKYKELAPSDWPHADLYQLLAYCVAFDLQRGTLIYAEPGRSRSEQVRNADITLDIIGVDLGQAPRDVLAATRHAALHLVNQANEQAGQPLAAVA